MKLRSAVAACAAAIALLFATTTMAQEPDPAFGKWLDGLVQSIQQKSDYRPLPLDTASKQEEFIGMLYLAFKGEVSHKDLRAELLKVYPNHGTTIDWVLGQLPKK